VWLAGGGGELDCLPVVREADLAELARADGEDDVRVAAGRYEAGVSLSDTRIEATEENSSAQAKADLLGQ
jgi:hypothetical protein